MQTTETHNDQPLNVPEPLTFTFEIKSGSGSYIRSRRDVALTEWSDDDGATQNVTDGNLTGTGTTHVDAVLDFIRQEVVQERAMWDARIDAPMDSLRR